MCGTGNAFFKRTGPRPWSLALRPARLSSALQPKHLACQSGTDLLAPRQSLAFQWLANPISRLQRRNVHHATHVCRGSQRRRSPQDALLTPVSASDACRQARVSCHWETTGGAGFARSNNGFMRSAARSAAKVDEAICSPCVRARGGVARHTVVERPAGSAKKGRGDYAPAHAMDSPGGVADPCRSANSKSSREESAQTGCRCGDAYLVDSSCERMRVAGKAR